ncbi:hypothetical protein ACHAQA_007859 [Verticillium albo-atrum]
MPSLGLEPVYPVSGSTANPRWRRTIDIVCVHGFGRDPAQTWYHDDAGKAWVADSDFLGKLGDYARVMLFTYNADMAANMNAASIAMHATELMSIIFMGTPHIKHSEPMLTCVKTTALLHARPSSNITTEDLREYVESAKAVNTSFTTSVTKDLEIVNFVEGLPTNVAPKGEPAYKANIVPETCSRLEMGQGLTETMDCTHEQLASFSSPVDDRYRRLQERLYDMYDAITHGSAYKPAVLPLLPTPKTPRPRSPVSTSPGSRRASPGE